MAKIVLKNVRASFVNIFEPKGYNGNDPKYSMMLLMPKDHPQYPALVAATVEAGREEWPAKFKGDSFPKGFKNPVRDGDEERDTAARPEYENSYFMNCSSKQAPRVVDRNPRIALTKEDRRIYSGCYVNVSLNTYAFDVSGNKGVALGLINVQFHSDGEALSGVYSNPEEDFDDESDVEEMELDDDELAG
ncbi:DUF2815 family protein [Pyramidobacter piscolens]|uniref:DUF2815 family protein n=1 Tax=Pyramidobacter piscolens TaxID=638849 RepID=UPI002AB24963|nr:DUF2815 family protein [Pyramidobacter piscolens]